MPILDTTYQYVQEQQPEQKNYNLFDYLKKDKIDDSTSKNISDTMQGLYQVLNAADWAQTRNISRNPNQFFENDSAGLIGHHPHKDTVDAYFALNALLHYVAPKILPPALDQALKSWKIGDKINVISGNDKSGIKMRF